MTRDLELTLVDMAKLRVRFDDDEELLEEIFRVFLSEVPDRTHNIRTALADDDLPRLTALAHSLKGVAGTMYAEKLRQAAYVVELTARAGEKAKAAALVDTLLAELAATAEDIDRFL